MENQTVPIRSVSAPPLAEDSALAQLQRTVRRQAAQARNPREDLVWQPRFAYTSAAIIFIALTVISLPLWIVLYNITGDATAEGAEPRVADLVGLSMMLLGALLTGAAAWTIIIEMRGRVRMVDTLARTSEREVVGPAMPELPSLDTPLDETILESPTQPIMLPLMSGPGSAVVPAHLPGNSHAIESVPAPQQQSVAATLEASSKLLSSFSGVLRAFGQLPAQVAMLAVALALFVGATVLSLK